MCKMRQCVYCVCVVLLFFVCVSTEDNSTRENEGFPMGFLPICPYSPKSVSIDKSQLKHLHFVVQGNGRSRQKYTYWTAKKICEDPRFARKRKTMLLALGYVDSTNFGIAKMFANLYEDLGYNVILMDNNKFSTVHYFRACKLMKPVGNHVAEVLVQLTETCLNVIDLELLGFSLGGHTIGYIAKSYQRLTGRNLPRLTALEPSGPCFRGLGPEDRLDSSDADFVDVIHTNIDGFGMATRMGHVDFYVNGGEFQPSNINIYPCTTTCSHFRSLFLWVSALRNPNTFVAIKCDSIQQARRSACYDRTPIETNIMGLGTNRSSPGIYYLATGLKFPYYLKEKGLSEESAPWRQLSEGIAISDV